MDSISQSVSTAAASSTGDVLCFAVAAIVDAFVVVVVVVAGRTLGVLTIRHVMSSEPPLVTVAHPDTALRQTSALSAWGHQVLSTV